MPRFRLSGGPALAAVLLFDPGNAISGTPLVNPQKIVDCGFLAGSDYGIPGTIQTWSARTDSHTVSGGYDYFCTVHDFMHGTVLVGQ